MTKPECNCGQSGPLHLPTCAVIVWQGMGDCERQRESRSSQVVRRGAWKVIFGEGDERWSMGDPGAPQVSEARHQAAHSPLHTSSGQVGILASIVSDMHYLVYSCPTTKEACEKLRALRAAVRQLGREDDDAESEKLSPKRSDATERK